MQELTEVRAVRLNTTETDKTGIPIGIQTFFVLNTKTEEVQTYSQVEVNWNYTGSKRKKIFQGTYAQCAKVIQDLEENGFDLETDYIYKFS